MYVFFQTSAPPGDAQFHTVEEESQKHIYPPQILEKEAELFLFFFKSTPVLAALILYLGVRKVLLRKCA